MIEYNKIETRGTDEVSASFYIAIKFTSVESQKLPYSFINPLLKVFCPAFFQKSGRGMGRRPIKPLSVLR